MPFLVDSVTMELSASTATSTLVIHPQFDVDRDITGALQAVIGGRRRLGPGAASDAIRESWMHIEIDRVPDDEDAGRDRGGAAAACCATSARPSRTGRRCTSQVAGDRRRARRPTRRRCPARRSRRASDLLRWLADDHFTFLGYREYRLETERRRRGAPRRPRHRPRHPARRPGHVGVVRQAARRWSRPRRARRRCWSWPRPTPGRPCTARRTSTTSASRRSTRTARSSASAASSACSPAPPTPSRVTRIPVLREKAREVLAPVGFDPRSHAGKALMDILETYPRDELFQTPVEELAPIAEAVMHTRERRQLRLFVRRDTYGRYLSCLVYLPRDRYNTTVRERISAILKEQLGGESRRVHAPGSASPRPPTCTSWSTRPRASRSREVDIADLERRLAEAARSWRDDFATAVMTEYGEEPGAAPGPHVRRVVPRGLQGGLPAAHRRRSTSAGSRRSRATRASTCRSTRRWTPAAARPGSRSSGSARRCRCPRCCRCCPSMGVEVVDERPYQLEGLGRAVLHLRVRAALRPAAARPRRASCSRTRCARCGTATTRSTASTRWCSAPG